MVVSVLQKTEEGERRAYKIDFNALETDLLLGSGTRMKKRGGEREVRGR